MIVQIPFRLRTIVCSLALAQLLSPIFCDMASNGLLDHHVAWLGYWCIHIGPSLPCCSALVRFHLLYNSAVVPSTAVSCSNLESVGSSTI